MRTGSVLESAVTVKRITSDANFSVSMSDVMAQLLMTISNISFASKNPHTAFRTVLILNDD